MSHSDVIMRSPNEELGEIGYLEDNKTTTFSFVYFNFLIVTLCIILWVLFLYAISKSSNRYKIRYYHNTISSYSASRDKWENRFLLTFTILISMNLLCMYTEEYNSRDWESEYLWLFIIETSACCLFPFVGIFYTQGTHIIHIVYGNM